MLSLSVVQLRNAKSSTDMVIAFGGLLQLNINALIQSNSLTRTFTSRRERFVAYPGKVLGAAGELGCYTEEIMVEIQKLGQIVDQLKSKVVLYRELFTEESSVAILNKVDSQAFSLIQRALLYEINMRIAVLFDAEKTNGNNNLTIKRLVSRIESSVASEIEEIILSDGDIIISSNNQALSDKVKNLHSLRSAVETLELQYQKTGIKKYRNKLGAHSDVDFVTCRKKLSVNIDFEILSSLLEGIFNIHNLVANLYSGPDKDQHIHRNTGMPATVGGKKILDTLENRITSGLT